MQSPTCSLKWYSPTTGLSPVFKSSSSFPLWCLMQLGLLLKLKREGSIIRHKLPIRIYVSSCKASLTMAKSSKHKIKCAAIIVNFLCSTITYITGYKASCCLLSDSLAFGQAAVMSRKRKANAIEQKNVFFVGEITQRSCQQTEAWLSLVSLVSFSYALGTVVHPFFIFTSENMDALIYSFFKNKEILHWFLCVDGDRDFLVTPQGSSWPISCMHSPNICFRLTKLIFFPPELLDSGEER